MFRMSVYLKERLYRRMLLVLALVVLGTWPASSAYADVIFSGTHDYNFGAVINAVTIDVSVTQAVPGGNYLWQYTATNNGFNPLGGNGFSGFELDLPAFPADLGNVTSPNANWVVNCCSGAPVEWDIPDSVPNAAGSTTFGPGIPIGQSGVFSFTSLPRTITNSSGWFHTWINGTQDFVTNYSETPGEVGPEVPNVLVPAIPEPNTLALLVGPVALLLLSRLRARVARR